MTINKKTKIGKPEISFCNFQSEFGAEILGL